MKIQLFVAVLFLPIFAQAETIKINAGVSYSRCDNSGCAVSVPQATPIEFDYQPGSFAHWTQKTTENGVTLTTQVSVTKTLGKYFFQVTAFTDQAGQGSEFQFLGYVFVPSPNYLNEITYRGQKFNLGNITLAPLVSINAL